MKRSILLQAVTRLALILAGVVVYTASALAGNLPATGQTISYQADKNDGITGPVDVPDDGALQRGATLHYKVLKDGTIKDLNTGLIWEVKVASTDPLCTDGAQANRDLHCENNTYLWSGAGSQETIWDWLDDLNNENGGEGYARHNDWRIPNVRELQSIVDYGRCAGCGSDTAAIDPIFGPIAVSDYWSSTTNADNPGPAWFVYFGFGHVDFAGKSSLLFVRAVRGGPK